DAGLAEIVAVCGLHSLLGARVTELADEEAGMDRLRGGDTVDDRLDLVDRLRLVAADLEVDERGVPTGGDRTAMDVLNGCHLRDACDHIVDRRRETGLSDASRAALDQDAFAGGLLEPRVEDPVHAARLARPGCAAALRLSRLRDAPAASLWRSRRSGRGPADPRRCRVRAG